MMSHKSSLGVIGVLTVLILFTILPLVTAQQRQDLVDSDARLEDDYGTDLPDDEDEDGDGGGGEQPTGTEVLAGNFLCGNIGQDLEPKSGRLILNATGDVLVSGMNIKRILPFDSDVECQAMDLAVRTRAQELGCTTSSQGSTADTGGFQQQLGHGFVCAGDRDAIVSIIQQLMEEFLLAGT